MNIIVCFVKNISSTKTITKNTVVKNVAKMLAKKAEMQSAIGVVIFFIGQKQKTFIKKIFVAKNVRWIIKEVADQYELV